MGRKIVSVVVQHDGVTLWEEGADSMTDYFPAIHGCTQREALKYIGDDGTTPGCSVECCNSHHFDEPEGKSERRARRFAAKAGLPYRDKVFFPRRATRLEAVADAAVVPGAVVLYVGEGWVDGHKDPIPSYQASTANDCHGAQIVAHPWIEAVAS
jgi:hypothetical protein